MQNEKTMKFIQIALKTIRHYASKTKPDLADLAAIDMIAKIAQAAIDRDDPQDRDDLREGRDLITDLTADL